VDVYDQHREAAQGASGLPAGLVVPHVSADDSARSRLSRRGTRLMLAQAHAVLAQGQDWQQSGVLELGANPIWHARAGWIKPARMVRAWLAQTGIRFLGGCHAKSLQRAGDQWLLLNADGQTLGQADLVVLANAHGSNALLQSVKSTLAPDTDLPEKLAALQQVHGTLSIGAQPPTANAVAASHLPEPPGLPSFPVNGNGSFLPNVPGEHGPEWFAGATYETDPARIADLAAQHQANADKLLTLLPHHAALLMAEFAQGRVRHWSQTRCVTHDRMPLVGPAGVPGLWLCVGMGSRGLSFAALCAQLLVAQIGAEPWPVEASLARTLHSTRTRRSKA
jgi:tRNA 5-methylaminomethyl-2-thiouridine biosynthesis bifunctional protein